MLNIKSSQPGLVGGVEDDFTSVPGGPCGPINSNGKYHDAEKDLIYLLS